MRLMGEFNVSNTLAAIAAAREIGVEWGAIKAGIAAVDLIPGRMERINEGQDFTAIVDFAHTPNALKRALQAGRDMLSPVQSADSYHWQRRLARRKEKRRLMAETAAQLADHNDFDSRRSADRVARRHP